MSASGRQAASGSQSGTDAKGAVSLNSHLCPSLLSVHPTDPPWAFKVGPALHLAEGQGDPRTISATRKRNMWAPEYKEPRTSLGSQEVYRQRREHLRGI